MVRVTVRWSPLRLGLVELSHVPRELRKRKGSSEFRPGVAEAVISR